MKKSVKRFNFTDVIIIIALIAIICGVFFRKPIEKIVDGLFNDATITYEVEISAHHFNDIKTDTTFYDENQIELGKVEKMEAIGAESLLVTIETEGKHDSRGNYIGDSVFIAPGKKLNLHLSDNKIVSALVKKVKYER